MRRTAIYVTLLVIALGSVGMLYWFNTRPMVVERANLGSPPPQIPPHVSTIGQRAPEFATSDKVVVVTVWASWCKPCMQELPRLENEIWRPFKPKIDVIGLGLGEKPAKVDEFKRHANLTFSLVPDPDAKIARSFGADHQIPQTFVIDRSGVIVYETVGYSDQNFDRLVSAVEKAIH